MKVAITGSNGFLGSRIVRNLLDNGYDVVAVHRPGAKMDLLEESRRAITTAEATLSSPEALLEAFTSCDAVIHTAAHITFESSKKAKATLNEANVEGTANVVNAAQKAGIQKLVYTSSVAALSRPPVVPSAPINERQSWEESRYNSTYGRTKYLGELEVHRGIAEGLDACMVNPSLIFGPGRPGENTMDVVERLYKGKVPAYPIGGTCVVDVDDVANGHRLALEKGETGQRYILGSENLLWRELLSILALHLDVSPPKYRLNPKLAAPIAGIVEKMFSPFGLKSPATPEAIRMSAAYFKYDNTKAREELGCTFRPFDQTASRVAAVVRQLSGN